MEQDAYQVGYLVSAYQSVVGLPDQLLEVHGRISKNVEYHGVTVFNNAASGIIWVENQVSLTLFGMKKV